MTRPPCSPCAAAAARRAAAKGGLVTKFRWISEDGMEIITYDTRLQAEARVLRRKGSYKPIDVSRNEENQ